ncbi:hypothetical protein AX17_006445 [Amanita inopinata Kibby_2008]|nr:hypothetical protein AX17_006445 [Amanita inopinata Kibby_2008]
MTSLPPHTEAAVQDVAEVYRTIPVKVEQWPGLIIKLLGEDQYAIDTCLCFGIASSAGVHRIIGDVGADLMCAQGFSPIIKWVNNHIFFQVQRNLTESYNLFWHETWQTIIQNGGLKHKGGQQWFTGKTWPNDVVEEWHEDMHPDQAHTYELEDIDNFSSHLSIPWQWAKDVPFAEVFNFIGMHWDIPSKTVTLTESKVIKYQAAISDWLATCTHMISELQKLYRKLMHMTNAILQGCTYLTSLEFMLPWFLHDLLNAGRVASMERKCCTCMEGP